MKAIHTFLLFCFFFQPLGSQVHLFTWRSGTVNTLYRGIENEIKISGRESTIVCQDVLIVGADPDKQKISGDSCIRKLISHSLDSFITLIVSWNHSRQEVSFPLMEVPAPKVYLSPHQIGHNVFTYDFDSVFAYSMAGYHRVNFEVLDYTVELYRGRRLFLSFTNAGPVLSAKNKQLLKDKLKKLRARDKILLNNVHLKGEDNTLRTINKIYNVN